MKKLILVCTLFVFSIAWTQIKIDNKKIEPKIIKAKLSQKFDFAATKMVLNKGVQTKWVPYSSNNKEMKVSERNRKETPPFTNGNEECKTITKTIDVNSATFMNSSSDLSLSKIYPGGIYPADDFLKGNYNREVK